VSEATSQSLLRQRRHSHLCQEYLERPHRLVVSIASSSAKGFPRNSASSRNGIARTCLNRFFISEGIPTRRQRQHRRGRADVSIASSSAKGFPLIDEPPLPIRETMSQSLLHHRRDSHS